MRPYRIREYGSFCNEAGPGNPESVPLPAATFKLLWDFVLENRKPESADMAPGEYFSVSQKRGVPLVCAQDYVGVLALRDGTSIEILPKIVDPSAADRVAGESDTLRIYREMLCTVKDIPLKRSGLARLAQDDVPLFEVFIRMFLDEVTLLVKRGLKCGYRLDQFQEPFLKGKLLFREQIRENLFRRDRFSVEHDDFQLNRPENRLLKSTLLFVSRVSGSAENRNRCRRLLTSFEGVEESHNVERDFELCAGGRNMVEYETALQWCRLFLKNHSLTATYGEMVSFALLFSMHDLYERYVAEKLRIAFWSRLDVTAQDQGKKLFRKDGFDLRPDIVVRNGRGQCVILDTKWKVLDPSKALWGITSGDMYQMYVYAKQYRAKKVILVYPRSGNMGLSDSRSWDADTEPVEGFLPIPVHIEAMFFDLLQVEESMKQLTGRILSALGPDQS